MITALCKGLALLAMVSVGVGSRGPVKFSNVTISRVRKSYWSVSATYPQFQSMTAVTTLANHELLHFSQVRVHAWAASMAKDMARPANSWVDEYTPTVVTARSELVSLFMTRYSDMEGAHPNMVQETFNYGFVKGGAKQLTLRDLFKPGFPALSLISKLVIAKLKDRGASWVQEGTVTRLDAEQGDQFVIKPDRLTFIFSPYEMGSYAEGTYQIEIPFTALESKLNPAGPLRGLLHDGLP